ncbi:MAG: hypothetical protein ACFFCQ_09180, partial [Promethearchaeota archaeon]
LKKEKTIMYLCNACEKETESLRSATHKEKGSIMICNTCWKEFDKKNKMVSGSTCGTVCGSSCSC